MQVEFKTGKGTVLFVKVPDDFRSAMIEDNALTIWQKNKLGSWVRYSDLPKGDWQFVGLSNELTEEQLTIVFQSKIGVLYEMVDYDYLTTDVRNVFKVVMQHLNLHEVNPYSNECKCNVYDNQSVFDACLVEIQNHNKAQERTGPFAVLFKPDEE